MLYGILAANKVHLSEIVRSLKEDIKLKKTIEAAVLSETGKMLLPVYEKMFSVAEKAGALTPMSITAIS